jgi:hypothetical protein
MPAIWSLIALIARRATGVSENRRRLIGVGFGMTSGRGPYVERMDGKVTVLRLPSAFAEDTSAIRRIAPRSVFVMFMIFLLLCVARAPSLAMQKTTNYPTDRFNNDRPKTAFGKTPIRIRICLQAYRNRRIFDRAFRRCGVEYDFFAAKTRGSP